MRYDVQYDLRQFKSLSPRRELVLDQKWHIIVALVQGTHIDGAFSESVSGDVLALIGGAGEFVSNTAGRQVSHVVFLPPPILQGGFEGFTIG